MKISEIDVLVNARSMYYQIRSELNAAKKGVDAITLQGATLQGYQTRHLAIMDKLKPVLVDILQKEFEEQVSRLAVLGITEFDK